MEQKKEDFKSQLAFGVEGEKEVAEMLIKTGVSILPLYQFNADMSPKILTENKILSSPDLTCFRNGKCFFVEVKSKKRWTICPKTNRIETGCDYRLYKQYLEISQKTGIELILVFNHVNNKPFEKINESSNGFFYVNIITKGRYWDGCNEKTKKQVHKPIYFWEYFQLKKM